MLVLLLFATTNLYGDDDDVFADPNMVAGWLGVVTPDKMVYSSYSTVFESGVAVGIEQMLGGDSGWKLIARASYSQFSQKAWPTQWQDIQIDQNPDRFQRFMVSGYLFFQHLEDPERRLVVLINGGRSAYILSNSDKGGLALAKEFQDTLSREVEDNSIYRGRALEYVYEENVIRFYRGVSAKYDWDSFVYDEDSKAKIRETIDGFLMKYDRETWASWGLPLNRGVLLYGPPGTGKSHVGKVLISQVLRREYPNKTCYIHVGARHFLYPYSIQAVYQAARMLNPCVVFIEDVDLIAGTNRASRQMAKNEFMQQLSGVQPLEGVMTIATTNYGHEIDPALLRSKRLGYQFEIGYPKRTESLQLLQMFLEKVKLSEDLELTWLNDWLDNLSGADLKQFTRLLMEEALRNQSFDQDGRIVIRKVDVEVTKKVWMRTRHKKQG